jgi:branched-subunit amino acid ABC-type transport system permease component
VVIVGGMGSVVGAAIGAAILGLAENRMGWRMRRPTASCSPS